MFAANLCCQLRCTRWECVSQELLARPNSRWAVAVLIVNVNAWARVLDMDVVSCSGGILL